MKIDEAVLIVNNQAVQSKHLEEGLVFAKLVGGNDESLSGGNAPQPGHRDFPPKDHHHHPGRGGPVHGRWPPA